MAQIATKKETKMNKAEYGRKEKIEFAVDAASRWLVDRSANWPKSFFYEHDEIVALLGNTFDPAIGRFKKKLTKTDRYWLEQLLRQYFLTKSS